MNDFRHWLQIIWQDYCQEHVDYNDYPILSMSEYFQKYKYWLKREYRYQKTASSKSSSMSKIDNK